MRLKGEVRKVQWMVGMKEEVEKFRAVIAAKIVTITLLIQPHVIATMSKIAAGSQATLDTSLDSHKQIEDCKEGIKQVASDIKNITIEGALVRTRIDRLVQICAGTKVGVEDFRRANEARHNETKRHLSRLQREQNRGFAMIHSQTQVIFSRVGSLEDLLRQLVRLFGGFTSVVVKILIQSLKTDLEIYALLREVHCVILRQPLAAREDSILFTDALGRTRTLQYEFFHHWEVFESMLKCEFKQKPGEQRVIQGQYHLLKGSRTKDLIIDRKKWELAIFPGSSISMSMVIAGLLFREGLCPRLACGARNPPPFDGSGLIICTICHLEYHCAEAVVNKPSRSTPANRSFDDIRLNARQAGGQDMHRSRNAERTRGTARSTDTMDAPSADEYLLEELEAFKAIHIQDGEVQSSEARESSSDILGLFLGQYLELKTILGIGVYGVVYAAFDHLTQTWYTVKALRKTNANRETLDKRQQEFQSREIRLHYMASAHPNIVSVLKIVDNPEYTYVVLDFCPAGDLFSNITERGRYVGDDALVRQAFLQILDAVEHCHRLGIYHRDLRPENILVSNAGNQVLLADFGLATTTPMSDDHGCGSTFYMSPECLDQSSKNISYRCAPNDVWSLGIILVNLTCGRNLWKQASIEDSTYKAFTENRDFLKTILPLSDELNNILGMIFESDPKERINVTQLKHLIFHCSSFSTAIQQPQRLPTPLQSQCSYTEDVFESFLSDDGPISDESWSDAATVSSDSTYAMKA